MDSTIPGWGFWTADRGGFTLSWALAAIKVCFLTQSFTDTIFPSDCIEPSVCLNKPSLVGWPNRTMVPMVSQHLLSPALLRTRRRRIPCWWIRCFCLFATLWFRVFCVGNWSCGNTDVEVAADPGSHPLDFPCPLHCCPLQAVFGLWRGGPLQNHGL